MAESIEVNARTVQEAIARGLAQLGLSQEEAEIVVLHEGSKGILGIGAEDARVRISRKAPSVAIQAPQPAPVAGLGEEAAPSPKGTLTADRAALVAQEVTRDLIRLIGINAGVAIRDAASLVGKPLDSDHPIVIDIIGKDLGILIGRRGETLSALQLIVNLIVGRHIKEWARVVVDVEGYRSRREEVLRNLALRMAERVRNTRVPLTLEAMPPHERRIIHLALKDNPYVTTQSFGEGEERRVTIFPRR